MTLSQRLFRSGGSMVIAQGVCMALFLGRSVVLARILGPEQFGLAMTYAIIMVFVDASLEFGPDKYILQARDGGQPAVVGVAHLFSVVRGACASVILLALADPLSALFHAPDNAWAYRLLAVAPLLKGLVHWDFRVRQRDLQFRPEILMLVLSAAAGMAVAVGVAAATHSHVAMLASVMAQAAVYVLLSFSTARTRYRLAFGKAEMVALYRFGWPLALNTLLLAAASRGDQALVGAAFGPAMLAVYATAAMLATVPVELLMRALGSTMLPVLGRVRGHPAFRERYEKFGAAVAALVIVTIVPIGLLGSYVIPLIFGDAYQPPAPLVAALAIAAGLSLFRLWVNIGALALGDSKSTLKANLVRTSGLGLAAALVLAQQDLVMVAMAIAAGELLAVTFGLKNTHRSNNLPANIGLDYVLPCLIVMLATLMASLYLGVAGWRTAAAASAGIVGVAFAVLLYASATLRTILCRAVTLVRMTGS